MSAPIHADRAGGVRLHPLVVFFGRDFTARFRLGVERGAEWAEFQKKSSNFLHSPVDSYAGLRYR